MSNAKITDATLPGHRGPFFPPCIEALQQEIYGEVGKHVTGPLLAAFGARMSGFIRIDRPVTSDKYAWFWSMHFRTRGGEVAILFPWSGDFGRADGTSAKRHIAVYRRGEHHGDSDIEDIVKGLLEAQNRRIQK